MTEKEWNASEDAERLIEWLFFQRLSDRKVRLFACACCRSVSHFIHDPRYHQLLTDTEEFADGNIFADELLTLTRSLRLDFGGLSAGEVCYESVDAACEANLQAADIPSPDYPFYYSPGWYESEDNVPYPVWTATYASDATEGIDSNWPLTPRKDAQRVKQLALLRDIFGNPFRPVTFAPEWRTEAAVGIAAKMYDSRDFGNMPILADALQDAGCELPDILNHCREPGSHVRGCWVVDLVLGKS